MDPNDPRHGKLAGYSTHQRTNTPFCKPCRAAMTRYNKERFLKIDKGEAPSDLISATGTRRRIQALMTLGWPLSNILEHAGVTRRSMYHFMGERINKDQARKIEKAYRKLMLRHPTTKEVRQQAITLTKKKATDAGWPGPMDWRDIENDPYPTARRKQEVA